MTGESGPLRGPRPPWWKVGLVVAGSLGLAAGCMVLAGVVDLALERLRAWMEDPPRKGAMRVNGLPEK